MLALSFKAHSVRSARLLLSMTAEAFICLHSLRWPGFIFTGGWLRLYLVFPDWHEVSVSSTRLLSSYTLLFSINPCISLIIGICCLLLILKSFSLIFFFFAMLGTWKTASEGSALLSSVLFLFSLAGGFYQYKLFCQILMVELDTGFPFWRLSWSFFLANRLTCENLTELCKRSVLLLPDL